MLMMRRSGLIPCVLGLQVSREMAADAQDVLRLVLLVLLAFKPRQMAADAHDAHGLV